MSSFFDRRPVRSIVFVAAVVAVSAAPLQAEGWKFWESKETKTDDGLGGTPYASSAKKNRSSGFMASPPSTTSQGWNIGAGVTNTGKSIVNGTTKAVSKTASMTKKAAKKTVDIVTLKPLWGSKPQSNPYQLGAHPDPRSAKNNKPALWGTSSKTTVTPRTPSEFFSQKPVR